MLFFVKFPHLNPLLVDAKASDHALQMARDIVHGEEEPTRAVPLPVGTFAAELFVPDDDDPEEEHVIVPLEHVTAMLDDLDDSDVDVSTCGLEAEASDGEVVYCMRAKGHPDAEPCEAVTSSGEIVTWARAVSVG